MQEQDLFKEGPRRPKNTIIKHPAHHIFTWSLKKQMVKSETNTWSISGFNQINLIGWLTEQEAGLL